MYNQYQLKDYGNDKNLIIQLVNMSCFIGVNFWHHPNVSQSIIQALMQ